MYEIKLLRIAVDFNGIGKFMDFARVLNEMVWNDQSLKSFVLAHLSMF